jgi:hypothetical protein
MNNLEKAFKIYNRIKAGNYSDMFYYHYQAELNCILKELKAVKIPKKGYSNVKI